MMTGFVRRIVLLSLALISAGVLSPGTSALAQENPPPTPTTIPCATGVSS
jgi:hypothetical protein